MPRFGNALFYCTCNAHDEPPIHNPDLRATQEFGNTFVNNHKHLYIKVPSAAVQGDFNILINPLHPDFNEVKIIKTEKFYFDERLFKK
ncbi:RES family NAD+ phosphorylase [Saccharicrinis sp. GN24d3]|uniref:RES family NAD+ phosphorylase n=1 Tax=Saccharicrinis sp. GN24d3 TaxID=3458416 RepID=UPI00403562DA